MDANCALEAEQEPAGVITSVGWPPSQSSHISERAGGPPQRDRRGIMHFGQQPHKSGFAQQGKSWESSVCYRVVSETREQQALQRSHCMQRAQARRLMPPRRSHRGRRCETTHKEQGAVPFSQHNQPFISLKMDRVSRVSKFGQRSA